MKQSEKFKRNKRRQKILISVAVLILFVLFLFGLDAKNFSEPEGNEICAYFLDTGQSDAVLIRHGERFVLIDSGDINNRDEIVSFLRSKDVKKIDALIISHPHTDHIGGAVTVLENFAVDRVYMPDIPENLIDDTEYFYETLEVIGEKGISFTTARLGIDFKIGEMEFEILSPDKDFEKVNDYSAVVRMEYRKSSFLFCGDIEEDAEEALCNGVEILSADVIKVPHHGAMSDLAESFFMRVKPRYAVITVGEDNSYGHPATDTLLALKDVGAEIYRTDRHGTIAIFCDGVNFRVETERDYEV